MKVVKELVYTLKEGNVTKTYRYKDLDRKLPPEGHTELLEGMKRLTDTVAENN